jgi:NAD(P)-dependent dehydrogenase (short-subunit alcohol dehydrogenase family)
MAAVLAPRTVVMTGGTSGFGALAAERLRWRGPPDVTGRTVDGFETTFAINHLAHYLLLRLLLSALARKAIVG